MLITENKMKEALALGREILIYEPNNRIILEYQNALKDYIDQGINNFFSFIIVNFLLPFPSIH